MSDMENKKDREKAGVKLVDVGLGMLGDQPVVILSYQGDGSGKITSVTIMDTDFSTKRQVPAGDVLPFHIKNDEILL